jgi:hypothetical protein
MSKECFLDVFPDSVVFVIVVCVMFDCSLGGSADRCFVMGGVVCGVLSCENLESLNMGRNLI